jgi:phenylalanyl-tRNA synthetase beta chain
MQISLNWLKEFVEIDPNLDPKDIALTLTRKTAEVEGVTDESKNFQNIVVGEILEISPHPEADKLQITKVTDGKNSYQVVCGANNIYIGMRAPLALLGAMVLWHGEGEKVAIKKTKVRGVESEGMLCAPDELGLTDKIDGILDLKEFNCQVGQNLAEVLKLDDAILEIDNKSLTHRPDLWGHYGFAREFAAIYSKPLKKYEPQVSFGSATNLQIKIENPTICSRFCACTISGLKIESSPNWLKKRLESVGMRSVNNIVDITNFVMLELGQPLHAYDRAQVKSDLLRVRQANEGEKILTLDHKEKVLTAEDIIIDNGENPLIIAGIMGGKESEISDATTEIILESATFDAVLIRKTSVRLGLRTDASSRFEKQLDPAMCELALKRACELILQICPQAKIETQIIQQGSWKEENQEINLNLNSLNRKIGMEISENQVVQILTSLGFTVTKTNIENLLVQIPSFRAGKDVSMEDDLVEEVARIFGYDEIPEILPKLPAKLPMINEKREFMHQASKIMSADLGFIEMKTYSFYGNNELEKALLTEEKHIKVENYLSTDQTHMRTTMLPNLIKAAHKNCVNFPKQKLFEIGRTYFEENAFFPLEEKKLTAILVSLGKNQSNLIYEIKSQLEFLLQKLNYPKHKFEAQTTPESFSHPVRAMSVKIGKDEIAKIFEVHPLVLKNFDLENFTVVAFELNANKLLNFKPTPRKYRPLAKFPGMEIDLSVVVEQSTKVNQLLEIIRKTQEKEKPDFKVINAHVFDIYQGDKLPENKKAIALRMTFQSDSRTLENEEMSKLQKSLIQAFIEFGGEVRGA